MRSPAKTNFRTKAINAHPPGQDKGIADTWASRMREKQMYNDGAMRYRGLGERWGLHIMTKKKGTKVSNDEAVKNLLIISLLKDGVDPELIAAATGTPEMTIRGRFPMKLIRKRRKRNTP